mgnify:FL=1
MANREIRRIINTKQDSLESIGNLSINSMSDGQVSIGKSTNELLSIRKKKYGRIYKSYMSSNGNQVVDRNLIVGGRLHVKGDNLKVDGILDVDGSIDLDGNFDINGTLSATQIVEHTGNTGTNIQFGTNTINFRSAHSNANGNVSLGVNSEGVIINNQGEPGIDFRVESDTIQNALKVDSGTNTLSSECVIIKFTALPTSDPSNAGQLWNDSGTLKISAG